MIVEDGSGIINANAYIDVQFAKDYHEALGNAEFDVDEDLQEIAIIRATQALDLYYGPKYASYKITKEQGLAWPRRSFIGRDAIPVLANEIPIALKKATAELALQVVNGIDINETVPEGTIVEEKVKVDVIETSVKYQGSKPTETRTGFDKIDHLLYPILLANESRNVRILR